MAETPDSLTGGATHGDRQALEVLLEQHLPWLRALVRLRAGPAVRAHESSSDLVQSVCREILEDLSRYRYQGEAAFKRWLAEAALHKILDRARYYRAAKRNGARELRLSGSSAAEEAALLNAYHTFCSPSQGAIVREEIARIESQFIKLPDDYQQVIVLARVVGLSPKAIAEQMQRSEASVRNLLNRALARLSVLLVRSTARGRQ